MRLVVLKKMLLCAVLLVSLAGTSRADVVKREFRSAWIATVANIDWPKQKGTSASIIAQQKADLLAYLDKMEEMNMTSVCFQVRSMCDAMYKSSYEPWSSYLTGTRGTDPGWDPLAFVVEECHSRGIEVYAWVNPYRWSSTGTTSTWNTDFDTTVKNNDWLITNGTFTVLNPGLDETRAHIVKVCKEIITNYSVEGLIFDDYFYPSGGTSEDSSAPDYQLWKSSGTSLSIADWRRENVDKMVTDVYNMVQETRPEVRFGIAPPGTAGASASEYGLSIWPGGYDTQYSSLYSDPLSWMDKGIVDFMSPQIYWHNDHSMAPFGTISNWWYSLAAHFKTVHCSVSINVYDLVQSMGYQEDLGNTQAHWDEHVENILQQRTYAAANGVKAFGSNFYSIQYLCGTYDAHGDYLAEKCFPNKALVPVVEWKPSTTFGAVNGLSLSDGSLSWDAVTDGLSTIRYTVYAVPTSVTREAAVTADGIDGQYLLGVTYAPDYTLPSDKRSGYWYAVCVYDGYGREHSEAVINYPTGNYADKASLIAPADGAMLEDEISFSWTTTDPQVTGFTLQVSSDTAFSVMKYSRDVSRADGETTSTTVNASLIGVGDYFWRVVSKGDTCFDTPSDYRAFTVTHVAVGEYEEGYTIMTDDADYAPVGHIAIESLWMRSVRDDFDNIVFAGDGTYNRAMVAVGDYVYLLGRTENSSTATAFFEKYSALTGEHIGRVTLGSAATMGYYPANNVIKDSGGNVCVSNLTMMQYNPLVVHLVNLETGEVTEVARIQSAKLPSGRFDHVSIIGDVTTGDFTIFGVATNTDKLLRWTFSGGTYTEEMTTISSYYPTSAASFGLAPRVLPVSTDDVFIDCSNTAVTRYTFSSGYRSGSFLANVAAAPANAANNGAAVFTVGDNTLMAFANSDHQLSPSNTVKLVTTTADLTFSDMSGLWVLPANGLGTVNSVTYQVWIDHVGVSEGKTRLFIYIPGNGMCAYDITDTSLSGVVNLETAPIDAPVEYYNLQGVKISGDNLVPGIYIKRQGQKVTKILIRD